MAIVYRRYRDRLYAHRSDEWAVRHNSHLAGNGQVVPLIKAWLLYAEEHKEKFDTGIGQDQVLGKEWAAIGSALRGLLNGALGNLDAGTLDSAICDTLTDEGFDPDRL